MLASAEPAPSAARSRYCGGVVAVPADGAVDAVADWARRQRERPVIFCQRDDDVLAFSRQRARIAPWAHLPLPPAALVEDVVDKVRFAALAQRCQLPLPPTRVVVGGGGVGVGVGVVGDSAWSSFPCLAKPARRNRGGGASPLVHIADATALAALPLLATATSPFVLQAVIDGAAPVVSYHCFARDGRVVADFTGRKRRGAATGVEISDDAEVKAAGRDVVRRLGFAGVVQMDFKRDASGRLFLLELDPCFSHWHHIAGVAGLSLPALVYADCTGDRGGAIGAARVGTRWVAARDDLPDLAARRAAHDVSIGGWVRDVVTADVNEDLVWRDPLPGLVELRRVVRGGVERRAAGGLGVRVVDVGALDAALRARWTTLQDSNPALAHPCFSFGFAAAVATVRDDVRVAVLERDGAVVGFFPHQARFGMALPVGGALSDHHGVVVAPHTAWTWQALLRGAGLAWFQFAHLPVSQTPAASTTTTSTASVIDLRGGVAAWQNKCARRLAALDRAARALARDVGPLRFVAHAVDPYEDPVLARVIALHAERCRAADAPDVFAAGWTRWLVHLIARTQSPAFSGRVSALYAGDTLVAAHVGMCSARSWHRWFAVDEAAFARHAPGALLLRAVVEAAAAAGNDRVDLGRDAGADAARFAAAPVAAVAGRVSRPALVTAWADARDAARPIWRRLRWAVDA